MIRINLISLYNYFIFLPEIIEIDIVLILSGLLVLFVHVNVLKKRFYFFESGCLRSAVAL